MDRDPALAELSRLRWIAAALVVWLALATGCGGLAAMALLYAPYDVDSSAYQIVLCATGGAFGAGLGALLSVVTRISRGWELGDGARRPLRGEGQRFAARLTPMYAVRPLLGAAIGLIAYFLLLGLLLLVLSSGSEMSLEPMGLLSVTLLAGFLSQTLLERMRQMLDALFGRAAPATSEQATMRTARQVAPDESTQAPTQAPPQVPTQVPTPVVTPAIAPAVSAATVSVQPVSTSAVQQPEQLGLQGGAAGDQRG